MTSENVATVLSALKIDLGIKTNAYDQRLSKIIESSASLIAREGAEINVASAEDLEIIVMYAAWLWRRRDTGEGMPRMLRWQLNNRILGEKAAE